MTGGFGTTSQSGSSGLFGKPITNFGTPATTATNSFPFNSTSTTNLFGTNTQTKPFGSKLHYFFNMYNIGFRYIIFEILLSWLLDSLLFYEILLCEISYSFS